MSGFCKSGHKYLKAIDYKSWRSSKNNNHTYIQCIIKFKCTVIEIIEWTIVHQVANYAPIHEGPTQWRYVSIMYKTNSYLVHCLYFNIWHNNLTWNLILQFTVSGRTIKLISINWMDIHYFLPWHPAWNSACIKLDLWSFCINDFEANHTILFP